MKTIELTQEQMALVDDEDFERLNKFIWHAWWSRDAKTFYARRMTLHDKNGKQHAIWMHRIIMGLGSKKDDLREIDHKNHNGLDNTKENIQITTHRENHRNRRDQSKHGVGIYLHKKGKRIKRYQSWICIDGHKKSIGYFTNIDNAKEARDKYIRDNNL